MPSEEGRSLEGGACHLGNLKASEALANLSRTMAAGEHQLDRLWYEMDGADQRCMLFPCQGVRP